MLCRKKPFLKLTTDGTIDHSGEDESRVLGTDRDSPPLCIALIRKCYVNLGFVPCIFFKVCEPLPLDTSVEIDGGSLSPQRFVSTPVGNQI